MLQLILLLQVVELRDVDASVRTLSLFPIPQFAIYALECPQGRHPALKHPTYPARDDLHLAVVDNLTDVPPEQVSQPVRDHPHARPRPLL